MNIFKHHKNIKKKFLIGMLFLTTHQLFPAGAHLSIAAGSEITSVKPIFYSILFGKTVIVGGCTRVTDAGCLTVKEKEIKDVDSGPGFTQIDWIEELKVPDQQGNRFVFYSLVLPSKIEGLEGWRDWTFLGNGRVNIGNSGLLKAFGVLKGDKVGAGLNPFYPRDWFPK